VFDSFRYQRNYIWVVISAFACMLAGAVISAISDEYKTYFE